MKETRSEELVFIDVLFLPDAMKRKLLNERNAQYTYIRLSYKSLLHSPRMVTAPGASIVGA